MKIAFDNVSHEEARRLIDAYFGISDAGEPLDQYEAGQRALAEEQPQKPRRKRRTKAEMDEARAAEAEGADHNVTDEDGNFPEEKVDEKPVRRRRRRPQVDNGETRPDGAAAGDDDEPSDGDVETPVRRRRRRASSEDDSSRTSRRSRSKRGDDKGAGAGGDSEEEITPDDVRHGRRQRGEPEESAKASARRRQRSAQEVAEGDVSDDEITDRDVAKAASDGAQQITPAAVRKILDQFAVANVGDLNQGQRREFIDLIEDAIADDETGGE